MIIPGKGVFASSPELPRITNGTKGALTDAQVLLVVPSDWRTPHWTLFETMPTRARPPASSRSGRGAVGG